MTQMTAAQARVIDPVLTEVARGYVNGQMAGAALFPVVPVGQRGGKIIQFGTEAFRLYETRRAPGGTVARITAKHTSDSFSLESHALAEGVPIELMEDAAAVPGIDLGSAAVRRGQDIIQLRAEKAQSDLARDPDRYGSDNKDTLSGSDQWTDQDSTPIQYVTDKREVVRSKIGRRPNTLLLGAAVWAALHAHEKVVDRFRYTGRDSITPEMFGSLVGMRVVIGDAIYFDDDGVPHDVWGNDAILAYTEIAGVADAGRPSYGYTYRLRNYPVVERPYYDPDTRSWVYQIADEIQPVLAGPAGGFLIKDAV